MYLLYLLILLVYSYHLALCFQFVPSVYFSSISSCTLFLFFSISFYFTHHPCLLVLLHPLSWTNQIHSYLKSLPLSPLCLLYSSPRYSFNHSLTCCLIKYDLHTPSFFTFMYYPFYTALLFIIALFTTWHCIYTCLLIFLLLRLGCRLLRTDLCFVHGCITST